MRVAVAVFRHQDRGEIRREKCARARYSFWEKFKIRPPPPYLGLVLRPQMPDDLAESPVDQVLGIRALGLERFA